MNTELKIKRGIEVIQGCDDLVREWVSRELGVSIVGDVRCFGILDGGRIIGGAVLHNFKGFMVECSFATVDRRWCTRAGLRKFFDYVFNILDIKRLHAACARKNKKMRKLFNGLGFKYEGCARKAFDGRQDAMIYSMLNNECRWL